MALDKFICGTCEAVFHEITEFVDHKSAGCSGIQITDPETDNANGEAGHAANSVTYVDPTLQCSEATSIKPELVNIANSSSTQTFLVPFNGLQNAEVQSLNNFTAIASLSDSVPVSINSSVASGNNAIIQNTSISDVNIPQLDDGSVSTPVLPTGGIPITSKQAFTVDSSGAPATYSYVLTKEQLSELGIQSEGDVVGQCEEFADSSQVTILVAQQSQENEQGTIESVNQEMQQTEEGIHIDATALQSMQPLQMLSEDNSTRIHLMPITSQDSFGAQAIVVKTAQELHAEQLIQSALGGQTTGKSGKRRGRPKKSEMKTGDVGLPEPVENKKPPLPEIGPDGRYSCKACTKAFLKERHYRRHRCISWGDYIDISKKESIDNMVQDSGEEDTDKTSDFVWHGDKPKKYIATDTTAMTTAPHEVAIVVEQGEEQSVPVLDLKQLDANRILTESGENAVEKEAPPSPRLEKLIKRKKNTVYDAKAADVDNLPIFTKEADKIAFDAAMNVDLSFVDDLYSTHQIPQDVNEEQLGNAINFRTTKSLSMLTVYTCNACRRVFMSQSHCRLHCVSHTEVKPFRCIKCDYSTNAKGHLYTHIRQHTGQMYKCSKCQFSTGNKTHLIEHEETHVNRKQQCRMCKKQYSTKKSLINHIRMYHTSADGKEYLMEFMVRGPRNKVTMLHNCYICNRKFKKRIDRDRHLFCHNVTSVACMYTCELCAFSTYRQSYLDKHYLRHKIVYVCAVCEQKFASTVRLSEHLTSEHWSGQDDSLTNNYNYDAWKELYEKCIQASLYLREALTMGVVEVEKIHAGDEFHYVTKDPVPPESRINANTENSNETQPLSASVIETVAQPFPNEQGGQNHISEILVKNEMETLKSVNQQAQDNENEQGADHEPDADTEHEGIAVNPEQMVELNADAIDNQAPEALRDYDSGVETEDVASKQVGEEQNEDGLETDPSGTIGTTYLLQMPGVVQDGEGTNAVIPQTQGDPKSVYARLQYQALSMAVFQQLRQIYGNEECEFCGRLFYLRSDHDAHLQTHTGEKPFACEQCDFRAVSKGNLKRHVQREHEQVIFKCAACEFEGSCRTQLWSHQKQMHSGIAAICKVCNQDFPDFKLLKAHLSIKHRELDNEERNKMIYPSSKNQLQIGRRVYKCPHCEKTFLRAYADFQKHLWMHEGIKPFKCTMCDYACRSQNNLSSHMLRHSSEKPFLCNECGKAYKSKTALRWHVRSHKFGKAFKCTKCNYQALQKSHLTRHMETHELVKRHLCQLCDFSANTLGYMKIHYTRNHKGHVYNPELNSVAYKRMDPNTKVYKCSMPWCDYIFGNLPDMKRHLRQRHSMKDAEIAAMLSPPPDGAASTEVAIAPAQPQTLSNVGIAQEVTVENSQGQEQRIQVVQIEDAGVAAMSADAAVSGASDGVQLALTPSLLNHLVSASKRATVAEGFEFAIEAADGQIISVKRLLESTTQQSMAIEQNQTYMDQNQDENQTVIDQSQYESHTVVDQAEIPVGELDTGQMSMENAIIMEMPSNEVSLDKGVSDVATMMEIDTATSYTHADHVTYDNDVGIGTSANLTEGAQNQEHQAVMETEGAPSEISSVHVEASTSQEFMDTSSELIVDTGVDGSQQSINSNQHVIIESNPNLYSNRSVIVNNGKVQPLQASGNNAQSLNVQYLIPQSSGSDLRFVLATQGNDTIASIGEQDVARSLNSVASSLFSQGISSLTSHPTDSVQLVPLTGATQKSNHFVVEENVASKSRNLQEGIKSESTLKERVVSDRPDLEENSMKQTDTTIYQVTSEDGGNHPIQCNITFVDDANS